MAEKKKANLQAEKRKVVGRQVKKLRRDGVLPANIYGSKVKSQAVQVDLKEFLTIFKQVGETGIVELKVKAESKTRPVLIHNIQVDPVTDIPLHADFFQVDLKVKVTSNIPVDLIGESPAVEQKLGILIQILNEVEVEALPMDLPEKFSLNIGSLEKVNDALAVADLKSAPKVKILTSEKETLAKIEPLSKEEVTVPSPGEETAVEGEEGVEAVEGEAGEEKKGEEGKPEAGSPEGKKGEEGKPGEAQPGKDKKETAKPAEGKHKEDKKK